MPTVKTVRLYNVDEELCGTAKVGIPVPHALIFCGKVFVKDVVGYVQVTSATLRMIDTVDTKAWDKTKEYVHVS